MREILFKGKRVTDGKWLYGNLIVTKNGCHITDERAVATQVIPESVGQYIGIVDSNGNKIFEGDTVKYYNDTILKGEGTVAYMDLDWVIREPDKPSLVMDSRVFNYTIVE